MDPDRDLAERCLRGDAQAGAEFVDRYAPLVLATARKIVAGKGGDPAVDAEDVAQEVFLRLFKDGGRLLRSFDPARASLRTWLAIVARSMALDVVRRKRLPSVPFLDEQHAPAAEERAAGGEPLPIPDGLLPPRQRLVMHLLFEKEWKPREAAKFLGTSEQTVRSLKNKAVTKLRAFFTARPGGGAGDAVDVFGPGDVRKDGGSDG